MQYRTATHKRSFQQRQGIVTFWAIVTIPIFLIMLCTVLEIGNLWLARIQLKNALEAGALAAVKNWGDAKGGDTNISRQVAYQFTAANTINGVSVDLSSIDANRNYNVANLPNQNGSCNGVLVFGAITSDSPEYVFDAGESPSCVQGQVLFDVSANGGLVTGNAHEWGIRFRPDATLPANLTITRAEIRLQGGATYDTGSFAYADAVAPFAVDDNLPAGMNDAPDIFGLTLPEISESFLSGNSILRFDFAVNSFAPGDRFRFGVSVNGIAQQRGDALAGSEVFVQFSNGTSTTANLVDSTFGSGSCLNVGVYDAVHSSLAVVPGGSPIPDLPCPPSNGAQDGQSFVETSGSGGGGDAFAVRIQASVPVKSICESIFGFQPGNAGFFSVTARVDAFYDCTAEQPRIYHLDQDLANPLTDNYICP